MTTEFAQQEFLVDFNEEQNFVEIRFTGVNSIALGQLQTQVTNLQIDLEAALNSTNSTVAALNSDVSALSTLITAFDADLDLEINQRIDSILALNTTVLANHATVMGAIQDEANARAAALLAEAAARGAAIQSATGTLVTDLAALAMTVDGLATSLGGAEASIITVQQAISTESLARASQISALQASLNNAEAAVLSESVARSDGDSALASQIEALAATSGTTVFMQDDAPTTGMVSGDIWYDTNDGNKPYRYNGTDWIDVSDVRIVNNAAAIVTETNARVAGDTANANQITSLTSTVNTKVVTFAQASQPVATAIGDLWIDTDSVPANQMYRWNGTNWILVRDAGITANATALSALDTRVTNAEGQITTTSSSLTTLTGRVTSAEGVNTAQGTAISGLDVRLIQAEGTLTSQGNSITALQSTVNLRNRTFAQASAPVASNIGDLWIDTDSVPANQLYRWNGTSWVLTRDAGIEGNATAISGLTTRVTATEGSISTLSSSVTTLSGRIDSVEGVNVAQGTSISGLNTRMTTAEGTITSQGNSITSLNNTINLRNRVFAQASAPTASNVGDLWIDTDSSPANQLYRWDGGSWVLTRDAGIQATSDAVTSLTSRVTSAEGTISSHAGSITSLNSSVGTLQGDLDTAELTISAHTSSINTLNSDMNTVEARYGVKVNVNGHVAGFGLIATSNTFGAGDSEFIMDATRVKIYNGYSAVAPFYVSGGVVYMQNVVIQDAQISSLTMSKVSSGTLGSSLTANTAGQIMFGKSGYASGTGIYLGYSGGYVFDIGSPTNYMRWNGSGLDIYGATVTLAGASGYTRYLGVDVASTYIDWYGTGTVNDANAKFFIKKDGSSMFGGRIRGEFEPKAWANANCDTTPPTRQDAFNVSSVTRVQTGIHRFTFATALPNANYACVTGAYDLSKQVVCMVYEQTTTYVDVRTVARGSGDNVNPTRLNIVIFGSNVPPANGGNNIDYSEPVYYGGTYGGGLIP